MAIKTIKRMLLPKWFKPLMWAQTLAIFFLVLTFSCKQPDLPEIIHVEISPWLNGASVAFSFTFDDNLSSHLQIGQVLEKYEFRGSFFINPGLGLDGVTDSYKALVANGHELGNHSLNHPYLTQIDIHDVENEVLQAARQIFDVFGVHTVSFVHPHNNTNLQVDSVVFASHLFSRISYHPHHNASNKRIILDIGTYTTACFVKKTIKKWGGPDKWIIIAGHGVEGQGWEPVSFELIEQICQHLDSLQPAVWVGKFKEVAAYEQLLQELDIEHKLAKNVLTVNLTGFDAEKYKSLKRILLTVEIKLADDIPVRIGRTRRVNLTLSENNTYLATIDLKKGQSFSLRFKNGFSFRFW